MRFQTLFRKESQRFLRTLNQTLLSPIFTAVLYMLVFGISMGARIPSESGISYLLYLIPGLIMMTVLNNSYLNSATSIMTSKYHGDLEDLKVVPLTKHHIVWAMSFASLLRGVIVGGAVMVVGQLFHKIILGSFYSIYAPLWVSFFVVVGGLAFAQIGLIVGLSAKTFDQMNSFGSFLLLPLIYFGGVFYSLDHLHPFWKSASLLNPLVYFISGLRHAITDISDISVLSCAAVCMAFLLCTSSCAYYVVQKGEYNRF